MFKKYLFVVLEGMAAYGRLLLAPAEGWRPLATWRIAVWIAVLAETTAVTTESCTQSVFHILAETTSVINESCPQSVFHILAETTDATTEQLALRAAPSLCSISWQRPHLLQLDRT